MINLHLQRLSPCVRYLMSPTKFGLTIVLVFMFISVNMIYFLEKNSYTEVVTTSNPSNLVKPVANMGSYETISKLSSLQNSNTFLSINNTNTHQSVINTISYNDGKSINSGFLSSTASTNHNRNNDKDLITSVHRSLRVKRGLIQLASMIRCVSGCEPFQYKGYGCFCGLFGSGKPVDPIDKCCLKHDQCYAMAPCHQLLLYLMPYSWDCVAPGYANCALTDYERSKDKCGFSLCECDRVFAECISKYPCPSSKAKCPYKPMVLTVYGK